jgi:hypothetical protein
MRCICRSPRRPRWPNTSSTSRSFSQVLSKIGRAIGKPVQYIAVPGAAAEKSMLEGGMPPWLAHQLVDFFTAVASGAFADTTSDIDGSWAGRRRASTISSRATPRSSIEREEPSWRRASTSPSRARVTRSTPYDALYVAGGLRHRPFLRSTSYGII